MATARELTAGVNGPTLEAHEPHAWGLAAYWFSLSLQSAALMTIVVPRELTRLAQTTRTEELARLAAAVAVVAMLVPPVVGALSDRLRRHAVGRRPFVLVGTAINVAGLGWAMDASATAGLAGALLVSVVGQTTALAGYEAMLPEVVHPSRWGDAAGHRGVASLAGSVVGLAAAGATSVSTTFVVMIVTAVLGAGVTIVAVSEPPHVPPDRRPSTTVHDWARFSWIFSARFLVLFGQTLLMTFVLYFFEDVLHVATAASGTAVVAGLALVGAAASAYYVGQASDSRDRTRLVALAGIPMAVAVACFGLFPYPPLLLGLGVVWGLGYGAFISADWALALDSVPDLHNVARDMGVWGIASNLPAVLAPLLGGIILVHAATAAGGYRTLFLVAAGGFALGSILVDVSRQDSVTRASLRLALAFLVAGILVSYVDLCYRVRITGRLPRDRRGVLVVGNHLHDLEGMVIPVRLFLSSPWGGGVHSAASMRVLEPGFLASRGPRWLGWLAGGVNLAPILRVLGILPIENMPLRRPPSSWAYEVLRRAGDLPAGAVFTPEALVRVGPPLPRRLSDLWARGRWPQDAPPVSVRALREPYRQVVRTGVRRQIEDQLAKLAEVVDAGRTLYLTPEGRMSETGQMGRFRAALARLLPHAHAVVLAATAYDPWTGPRLAIHTRLVAPADGGDLFLSLAAARPVTLSQVLAAELLAAPDGVTEAALVAAVQEVRAPAGEGAAAPIRADAGQAVHTALMRMARRGVVRREGERWLAGCVRHDERFPHVPDLLAAQAQQFADTQAARRELATKRAAGRNGRPRAGDPN